MDAKTFSGVLDVHTPDFRFAADRLIKRGNNVGFTFTWESEGEKGTIDGSAQMQNGYYESKPISYGDGYRATIYVLRATVLDKGCDVVGFYEEEASGVWKFSGFLKPLG